MSDLTVTAVIPTRNRPVDLGKAVASVLLQTRLPDEFIIVDQSPGDESRVKVEELIARYREESQAATPGRDIRLLYLHDPTITGLVEAKKVAAGKASGSIVCYLEDDIILEPEYIASIEQGFIEKPAMLGCCGVMTNMPRVPMGYLFFYRLFRRGIFIDERVNVQYGKQREERHLIPCITICGGLSAWRREVFAAVPFDVVNGFHMMEDVDFSTRVAAHFGPHLFINPKVRAEHHWSQANREVRKAVYRRKLTETVLFYKKRAHIPWALFDLLWLLLGLLLEAFFKSLVKFSTYPMSGYAAGLLAGMRKKLVVDMADPRPLPAALHEAR